MSELKRDPLPQRMKGLPSGIALTVTLVLGLGVITTASAQTGHVKKSKDETAAQPPVDEADDEYETVEVAGQQVAVDRKTGRLRQPTREEAKALADAVKRMVNRSAEGLKVKHHDNGAMSVDLEGRFQSVSVARINPDGTAATECVTNEKEVEAFLGAEAKDLSNAAKAAPVGSDMKTPPPAPEKTSRKAAKKTRRGAAARKE